MLGERADGRRELVALSDGYCGRPSPGRTCCAAGRANAIDSVLQAGTAVLVDDKGVPRVRCKCGNPLLEGKQFSRSSYTGPKWAGFDSTRVTTIRSSSQSIQVFVIYNVQTNTTYEQPPGSTISSTPPTTPADCPNDDAGNGSPIVAAQGSTFTDSRGRTALGGQRGRTMGGHGRDRPVQLPTGRPTMVANVGRLLRP